MATIPSLYERDVLGKGYVKLLNHMGSDDDVVLTALICRAEDGEAANEKFEKMDSDEKSYFLNRLWKRGHESPFEFCQLHFEIKAPIFVARQWMRHRTGKYMERSARAVPFAKDDYYVPDGEGRECVRAATVASYAEYLDLLELYGVALEDARLVLPVNYFTVFHWSIDLRNLFHFLLLRSGKGAQSEMRAYAKAVSAIVQYVAPLSYCAFCAAQEGREEKEGEA